MTPASKQRAELEYRVRINKTHVELCAKHDIPNALSDSCLGEIFLWEENKRLREVILEADKIIKTNIIFPLHVATWRAHIKSLSSGGE